MVVILCSMVDKGLIIRGRRIASEVSHRITHGVEEKKEEGWEKEVERKGKERSTAERRSGPCEHATEVQRGFGAASKTGKKNNKSGD